MSLRKSVEEPNGSKDINPQGQDEHSDEAEMSEKNSDFGGSSGGDSTEYFLVSEVTSDNDSFDPEEMNVKSSDLEKDESIPETESPLLTKSGDSEGVGQSIDQLEEKDDILSGKYNTLQMLVEPHNELEEAVKSIILSNINEHIDKEESHEPEMVDTFLDVHEEFDVTSQQQDEPLDEDEVSGKEYDEFSESSEFVLVAEDSGENDHMEPEETRTESDTSDINLKSSDSEKDKSMRENQSPTFSDDLEETKKCEDLSIEDHEVLIPETESLMVNKSDPEQVVQNIGLCVEEHNTLIGNSFTLEMLVNPLNILENIGKSSTSPKDEHIYKENVLNVEEELDAFLNDEMFDGITSQHQDESAKEMNVELWKSSHLTTEAASQQSSATGKTLTKANVKVIDSSKAVDQSCCHFNCEWTLAKKCDLPKETAFREKRHCFIKITVLLDEYGTFFKSTCSFLRTDPKILNSVAFINRLVCKDCRHSSNPSVLLRSLGLIQALVLNPNCELTVEQHESFIDYLLFCLHTNPSPNIRDTFSHMIALLLAEFTKGQDPVHQALYLKVVDFIEGIILQDTNLDCRVCCNLIDSVLSMGSVAVCLLMPKIFPRLRKMVDDSLDLLNSTQEGSATGLLCDTQDSIQEFNRKMSDVTNALDLRGKLLDACELLMKVFFLKNFTHSDVLDLLTSSQGGLSDNNSFLLKIQYKKLEPFFKDCLEYFGEALTARLSLICTQYNCARYLEQLFEDALIYTFNNTFMNCNLLIGTWKNKERKRMKRENTLKPPCTKGQLLFDSHQIKTMFGESRCGLIHSTSSADVLKRDYETSQNSSTLSFAMKPVVGSMIEHSKEPSVSKLKAPPPVLKGESCKVRVLGEKPKVLRIPIKDFLRNRGIVKNVHKSISSGPSDNVVEQMDIDVQTSSGSVSIDTSSVENVPLPSDLGSGSVGTKHQVYLQTLKTPPNLSTLWLDKLSAKYSIGHKVKPMHWKSVGNLDIFI